jgi:hypothetical protein
MARNPTAAGGKTLAPEGLTLKLGTVEKLAPVKLNCNAKD